MKALKGTIWEQTIANPDLFFTFALVRTGRYDATENGSKMKTCIL